MNLQLLSYLHGEKYFLKKGTSRVPFISSFNTHFIELTVCHIVGYIEETWSMPIEFDDLIGNRGNLIHIKQCSKCRNGDVYNYFIMYIGIYKAFLKCIFPIGVCICTCVHIYTHIVFLYHVYVCVWAYIYAHSV